MIRVLLLFLVLLAAPALAQDAQKGPIKVMADNACPEDRAFVLDMSTWTLLSAGDDIHLGNTRNSRFGGNLPFSSRAKNWRG